MKQKILDNLEVSVVNGATRQVMTGALLAIEFDRGNIASGVYDDLEIGNLSLTVKGTAWAPATNPLIRRGTAIEVKARNSVGNMVVIWAGTIARPISIYRPDGTPITTITAYDAFGTASARRAQWEIVYGNMTSRIFWALINRTGTKASLIAERIGNEDLDDADRAQFGPYARPDGQTTLEQLTIIRNSRNGAVWAGRAGGTGTIRYRTSSSPPTALGPTVLTFTDRDTPPPAPVTATHRWTSTAHISTSEKVINGSVVATNLVKQPTFQGPITEWTLVGAASIAATTERAHSGTRSLKITADANSTVYSGAGIVLPNLPMGTYTFSAWVYLPAAYGTGIACRYIAGGQSAGVPSDKLGEWVRIRHTFTIPRTLNATLYFLTENAKPAAGAVFYLDDVQMVAGDVLPDYFDGSTPPAVQPLPPVTDLKYTDLVLSHDSDTFTTAVAVNVLRPYAGYDAGTTFGPYVGNESGGEWERRDETIVLSDFFSSPSVLSQLLLGTQPLPGVTVKSVTINGLDNRLVFDDDWMYQIVQVKSVGANHSRRYHVIHETHTITPDSWSIRHDLKNLPAYRSVPVTDEKDRDK